MEKRLQTILSRAGVASRRSAAEIIESGRVRVDGRIIRERGFKIDPGEHEILLDGKVLRAEEEKLYFLFNKPIDVISTVKDTHGRKKITDYFKHIKARLYPVGRLDRNTAGLIIVTNDGDLANRLSHPRFNVDKEYLAVVNGNIPGDVLVKLQKGVKIDGTVTAPCNIRVKKRSDGRTVLRVNIHEGRKRQIRRMFRTVGFSVLRLSRVKYAGLKTGTLPRGRFRPLTKKEIERLKMLR